MQSLFILSSRIPIVFKNHKTVPVYLFILMKKEKRWKKKTSKKSNDKDPRIASSPHTSNHNPAVTKGTLLDLAASGEWISGFLAGGPFSLGSSLWRENMHLTPKQWSPRDLWVVSQNEQPSPTASLTIWALVRPTLGGETSSTLHHLHS